MTEKNPRFPSALQALLLIVALFVAEYVVGALLHDAQGALGLTTPQAWALDALIANGCVFATVMQYRGLTYRQLFHPAATSMRDTALSLVPYVLFLIPALVLGITMLVTLVTRAFPLSDGDRALFETMSGNDLATVLIGCVIAPVVEEMLFRGIILRGFLQRYGRAQAIWASAALFGLAHMNIYQFVAALALGAVSGWLYARSRSLVPCIALHAAYNTALSLLATTAADADASQQPTLPAALFIATLLLAAVGVLHLRRIFNRQDSSPLP
jgi:membrane protease YdiL (CAAX protease family)